MELKGMNCPHCGGPLEITDTDRQVKCPYCDSAVHIDRDEPPAASPEENEQAGYAFEKGRIRAQQEARRQEAADQRDILTGQIATALAGMALRQVTPRRPRHLFWWIVGWIFCFPIPLTVLIARSRHLKPLWKAVLLILLWGFVLLNGTKALTEWMDTADRGSAVVSAESSEYSKQDI